MFRSSAVYPAYISYQKQNVKKTLPFFLAQRLKPATITILMKNFLNFWCASSKLVLLKKVGRPGKWNTKS